MVRGGLLRLLRSSVASCEDEDEAECDDNKASQHRANNYWQQMIPGPGCRDIIRLLQE